MEKAKISSLQLFMLMTGFLFGSTLIINPITSAKNDGWLALIIGGISGILLIWMYVTIALLNHSKNFVEILKIRLGKVLGSLVAILYVWYFTHLASLVLRNFSSFITTISYIYTPMEAIIVIFAIVIVYAVNSGIEVVGRVSELLVPVIPIIAVLISISVVTVHDFTAFLPVLENGIRPVLKAAYAFLAFPFGETITFLMIFPHTNKRDSLRMVSTLSGISATGLFLFIFFRDITTLGSHFIYQATYVPHITSMLIPGINLEPLLDVNLLIGGGIKTAICIYAASTMLADIIGARDYRKLTTALLTFCVVLSIWIYQDIFEMFNWAEKVWPYYSIPFQLVIPFILFTLSLINRNKCNRSSEK